MATKNGDPGEYQGSPEVKTALIRGMTFAVKPVQYAVVEGLALFEGDIVLGTAEQVAARTEQLRREQSGGPVTMGVVITGAQFRWPNCRVPFTIDPALPNQARVTQAIAHWEAATSYRFVPRTSEADWVTFRPGSGCSSHVGRQGGQQFVNLAAGCTRGSVIHEIGHVIGLWHEQSRADRDTFITINWAKIQAGMEHNFNQHITDGDDVGQYDYGSIMHYPRNAFSVDGSDTITPVTAGATIGQRDALSAGDVAAANSLCQAGPTIKEITKEPVKEAIKEGRKEFVKEMTKDQIRDTRKELIKDLRWDTIKEMVRDTVKEGVFDPGPTIAEVITVPGRPVIRPNVLGQFRTGAIPFAAATPQPGQPVGQGQGDLTSTIMELDATLQTLGAQIAQGEAERQTLQSQYDETAALLQQLLAEHEAQTGGPAT